MKGRLGRFAVLATALALAVTGTVTVTTAAASPQEGAVLVPGHARRARRRGRRG